MIAPATGKMPAMAKRSETTKLTRKEAPKRAPTEAPTSKVFASPSTELAGYETLLGDVDGLIQEARRSAARAVNAVMTATYWLVGRRIVKEEQRGKSRAGYGDTLI